MKVLVTGHRGYIGPWVVTVLASAGHDVTGCDIGLYEDCQWEALRPAAAEWRRDFRSLGPRDLEGFDAVIHLAAISNDPMGALDPALTLQINRDGAIELAHNARDAGVRRFVFAGSCSVYGRGGEDRPVDEDAPLAPLSAYARSKVEAEQGIAALLAPGFAPVLLRNATAFGHSPMLRIDLVLNNLLAHALAHGEIGLVSDGTPWRPLVHCRDIAAVCAACLDAPTDAVAGAVLNVGSDASNHRVREIAAIAQELVPGARLIIGGESGPDPRSYRVSFGRLRRVLPDLAIRWTLRDGAEDLCRRMREHRWSASDLLGDRFVRLRRLPRTLHLLAAHERAGV